VLLCEDVEQRSFFEGLCKRLGFVSRVVRVEIAPPGSGAAEQWVRARYPGIVKAYRAQANHLTNGVLTVIDGDLAGVGSRLAQLDEALRTTGPSPRRPEDRIAVCVPTRSIETWLAWLCALDAVDELTRYKRDPGFERARETGLITAKGAIDGWFSVARPGEPPSLTAGRKELERLQA